MKKYVFVIYDPLAEKVLCVHEKSNMQCRICGKKKYETNHGYYLQSHKRSIKTK